VTVTTTTGLHLAPGAAAKTGAGIDVLPPGTTAKSTGVFPGGDITVGPGGSAEQTAGRYVSAAQAVAKFGEAIAAFVNDPVRGSLWILSLLGGLALMLAGARRLVHGEPAHA
jgi:hypothetical protein